MPQPAGNVKKNPYGIIVPYKMHKKTPDWALFTFRLGFLDPLNQLFLPMCRGQCGQYANALP